MDFFTDEQETEALGTAVGSEDGAVDLITKL